MPRLFSAFHPTLWICLTMLALSPAVAAQQTFTLSGRVVDGEGRGVAGAEVALYTSADVRRPVDFIAPPTTADGSYTITVPTGKYWVVARQRQNGRYGPLQPADRHSGTPVEIDGEPAQTVVADFKVTAIREMRRHRETSEDAVMLKGRLTDKVGAPVANAYLYARREKGGGGIPDFISPTVDKEGEYTMSLPSGRYFLGADVAFPPREGSGLKEVTVTPGKTDIVIDMEVQL